MRNASKATRYGVLDLGDCTTSRKAPNAADFIHSVFVAAYALYRQARNRRIAHARRGGKYETRTFCSRRGRAAILTPFSQVSSLLKSTLAAKTCRCLFRPQSVCVAAASNQSIHSGHFDLCRKLRLAYAPTFAPGFPLHYSLNLTAF